MDGPRDWIESSGAYPAREFPSSCCDDRVSICQFVNANTEGCFKKLEMRVQNGATVLIGVGIGIAFVEASKVLVYNIF